MTDNLSVVQSAYAAFGRGDIGAIIDLLDDGVRWSSPGTLPHGGDFTGKKGVTEFFEGIGAAWESLQVEVETAGAIGADGVLAVVNASGTLKKGESADYGAAHAFTVNGE